MKLSAIREQQHLTRPQAAKKLEIGDDYLRQIEAGSRCPNERLARAIASLYGCSNNIFLVRANGRSDKADKPKAPNRRQPKRG